MDTIAVFENRRDAAGDDNTVFHDCRASLTTNVKEDVASTLQACEAMRRQGLWCVGYISYEAGVALNPALTSLADKPWRTPVPLIHFLGFARAERVSQAEIASFLQERAPASQGDATVHRVELSLSPGDHANALKKIKQYQRDGETYQVNLTGKYYFECEGSPLALYRVLRDQQKVKYSAYLQWDDWHVLSLSPELFFKKSGSTLVTRPMKGTAARAACPQDDEAVKVLLQRDPKTMGENIIIVDLLRNDLSQVALKNSVKVNRLLEVETYESLHQMVSEIQATVPDDLSVLQLMQALLPCGSITGAPKTRTLEIIHELELEPRGIYTGAIGYVAPNNDMCFNVPIRTCVLRNGKGEMGVGGGIVYDSVSEDEYAEMVLKANFLLQAPVNFELVECLYYSPVSGYRYQEAHCQRLLASARQFHFVCDIASIEKRLADNAHGLHEASKVKLILTKQGDYRCENATLEPAAATSAAALQLMLSSTRINSHNPFFQHKTSHPSVRGFYVAELEHTRQRTGCDEVVFANERDEITETTIYNVIIEKNKQFKTSPQACGLLPGILRGQFCKENSVHIAPILIDELYDADKIWCCNAIRGMREAVIIR